MRDSDRPSPHVCAKGNACYVDKRAYKCHPPPKNKDSKIVAGFDWDEGNREKCQKHGVMIAEIESVFAGTPAIGPDAAHSTAETRFLAIGRASSADTCF
jgi:hypothetical protein